MTMAASHSSLIHRRGVCTPAARIFRVMAVVPALLLALGAGQVAWADHNPSTCISTGPALLLSEFRDLDNDGIGESPITGSKVAGETIYYQATLFQSSITGQCAYNGGSLCIDPPGPVGCTVVTPVGGIPLICDNPAVCNPDGVPSVLSLQLPYTVTVADLEAGGDCVGQVRAVARYTGGTSHFTTDVTPINADTPICNPVLFCGDGIVGNTTGETCDPPGSAVGSPGETCRQDCTFCGDGHVDAGETCDDGNEIDNDDCRNTCVPPVCGDGILNRPGETCDPPGSAVRSPGETCRQDCTFCGDGHLDAGETCDDGNEIDNDDCLNTSVPPVCGDGIRNRPGETCDPPGSAVGSPG